MIIDEPNYVYLMENTDNLVDLLERIYGEVIRVKSKLKIIEQQIQFNKVFRSVSPIPVERSKEEYPDTLKLNRIAPYDDNSAQHLLKTDVTENAIAAVIHDHSSLQVAVRRLVQMLDEMRERRDDFVNTYTVLLHRFEQLEMTTALFLESQDISRGRTRSGSFLKTMPVTKKEHEKAEQQRRDDST